MEEAGEQESFEPIRDPKEDDYNQRQRLKEIWDERNELRQWRREISHSIGQSISQQSGERHYHEELKQYIEVIHTLLLDVYADQGGEELWYKKDLGEQIVKPPSNIANHVEPKTVDFNGLKRLIETPSQRTVSWETEIENHHKSNETITGSKTVTVPWNVLDTAWMYTNSFLAKFGFEARQDEKQHRSNITTETIEEVDKWRKRRLEM